MPDIFTTNSNSAHPAAETASVAKKHASLNTFEQLHYHPFATYCTHPVGVSFQNQDEDEKILLILRKHFITNVPWIITTIFLLLFPIFGSIIFNVSIEQLIIPFFHVPTQFITFLLLLYYLCIFAYVLINIITWFYNVSLVSTKRVVDIDFSDVIYHNVAATKLSLVQDVDYTQSGAIRSLFNYGDVFVQTASESPNFDFLAVPKPATVINIIENLIGKKPYVH